MRSEATKKAQKRYQEKLQRAGKLPRKTFLLSCHTEHDADIIEALTAEPNANGYLKELIREDRKRRKL